MKLNFRYTMAALLSSCSNSQLGKGVLVASSIIGGGSAMAEDRPNILVLIADDISRDDFSCYGNKVVKTPNIDAIARDGVKFDNLYVTTSSSSPSRASIITGRYPHNTGAAELSTPLGYEQPYVVKALHDSGYYTAHAGKWHFGEDSRIPVKPVLDYFDIAGGSNKDGGGVSGSDKWLSRLKKRPTDKPFFMWLAAHDAHRKWDDDNSLERYSPKDMIVPKYLVDEGVTRQDLADYYYEVARFDHNVGEVINELKRQGEFDNTLIIIMADNGRPFARAKTRMLREGVNVPFIVRYPELTGEGGKVCKALISSIDIASTISDVAGVDKLDMYQGRSFVKLLSNPDMKFRNYAFAEHNWHDFEAYERMVTDGRYIYIENSRTNLSAIGAADVMNGGSSQVLMEAHRNGELTELQNDMFVVPRPAVELYDLQSDPETFVNIASKETLVVKRMAAILKSWREQTDDTLPDLLTPDRYSRETLTKYKNYLNRGEMPGLSRDAKYNKNKSIF